MMPDITTNLTDSQKVTMNVVTLNTAVNELQEDMKAINKIVVIGNGELPLREQVRSNTKFIDGIRKLAWIIGGAIIVQTIAFSIGVAIAYFRYLPILETLSKK